MADKLLFTTTGCLIVLIGIGLFLVGAWLIIQSFLNGILIPNAIIGTAFVLVAVWIAKLGSMLTDRASSDEDTNDGDVG